LLTLTIKDKSALYLAYMPFVKNGGLFIPTNSNYRLGDEVFMLLNLMGEEEKLLDAARELRRLASTGMNQQLALEALLLGGRTALAN
jgi:Tfp pilus assembly protein PilZ